MSLRSRFLLVVVVASVIPLALVGLWLTGSATRSGERFLQARLETALGETVQVLTNQWVRQRSVLLSVADAGEIQDRLAPDAGNRMGSSEGVGVGVEDLDRRFPTLDPAVRAIDVLAPSGVMVERLERPHEGLLEAGAAGDGMLFNQELPVYRRTTGERLGALRVWLTPTGLLPPGRLPASAAGMVITLVDRAGRSLLPAPIPFPQGGPDRFTWAGESWMARTRELEEPALSVLAASTLGPAMAPFEETARRGTLALLAVALLAMTFTALLTRRLTRSLQDLSDAADAVSRGDLDRRVDLDSDDELGRVARAFNHMTRRLQRTLDRMAGRESLAAVGEFAAGLAHEVRNPLTAVQIDLQFVEAELPPGSPLLDAQRKALAEIRRLDSTVRDALRVARSGKVERRAIDMREPLEAAAEAARPTFEARGATLSLDRPEGPIPVQGDPDALEQLFLNVLQNAGEALAEGGRASVEVERCSGEVRVRVRDDGPGMPAPVRARAFEPLFSTRREGTGLGLPIAQRIALAHEGAIHLTSEHGTGTTVDIELPSADGEPSVGPAGSPGAL